LPLGAGAPVWSPDGTKIAFGAPVDLRAVDGEDDAARARRAAGPVVTRRLDYKADGAGLLGTVRTHLHVLDLASERVTQVTEGDWHAGGPVWSPDSARLAFAAATAPDADMRFRAPVYSVDVSGGFAKPELVALADGIGTPTAWTPDGSALIVVDTPIAPPAHRRLASRPARSRCNRHRPRMLPRQERDGAGRPQVSGRLARAHGRRGHRRVLRPRSGLHPPLRGRGRWKRNAEAGRGRCRPGRIRAFRVTGCGAGRYRRRRARDAGQLRRDRRRRPGLRSRDRHHRARGRTGRGRVLRPAGAGVHRLRRHRGARLAAARPDSASGRCHCCSTSTAARTTRGTAPRTQCTSTTRSSCRAGWTVLLLNPRASDGYGEAFYSAAIGAWGQADAKDFLEPIDQLVAEGRRTPRGSPSPATATAAT
jgi:hypothetical protein